MENHALYCLYFKNVKNMYMEQLSPNKVESIFKINKILSLINQNKTSYQVKDNFNQIIILMN